MTLIVVCKSSLDNALRGFGQLSSSLVVGDGVVPESHPSTPRLFIAKGISWHGMPHNVPAVPCHFRSPHSPGKSCGRKDDVVRLIEDLRIALRE